MNDLGDLAELRLLAVLATYRSDGTVLLSPVWHEWRDGAQLLTAGVEDAVKRIASRCLGSQPGAAYDDSACTVSELGAGSLTCGLAGPAGWGKIAVRVCHAGNPAGLAPPSGHPQVDLPEPARPPAD